MYAIRSYYGGSITAGVAPATLLLFKKLSEEETINADLSETQFDQLARAMGAHGERVSDPKGLKGAIERSIANSYNFV